MLCDRRMNLKIKGKVYRTVVRLALLCRAGTLPSKKAQENKLEAAETRMLRCMCAEQRGENESPGNEVGMLWACGANRGALYRNEGNRKGSTREEEYLSEDSWIE